MNEKYIRVRDLKDELGITAKGLDNAIKRKEIVKHYPYEKNIPYVLRDDAEILKKHIANNGRVKSIIEKDKRELELEKENIALNEERKKLLFEIEVLNTKFTENILKVEELQNDKESFKSQIDHLQIQANKYQERLEEANKLLLLEKAESEKFKKLYTENKTLLLAAQEEKEKVIIDIESNLNSKISSLSLALETQKDLSLDLQGKLNDIQNYSIFKLIKYKYFSKK